MVRLAAGALAALLLAAFAAPAEAQRRKAYRDPPSYRGITRVPPTAPPRQPPAPPAVQLSATGQFPDVLVDEAGTAHIVWNEGRGDDSDAAFYCRLKRGAAGCDATAVLTWEKSYGSGDGPQFNTDYQGPKIVRVGDQLVVFSKRYPTIGDKPDGASSHTVLAWSSSDGGSNWSSSAIVGRRDLAQMIVLVQGDQPLVAGLAHDPFCGGMCITSFRSGQYSTDEGVLNTDPNSNYNPTLVNDGGAALAAFSDLEPRIWLRRWNGQPPITDPANWSTSAPIPGDEPELASGPSGPFLMQKPGYSGNYQVRRLAVQPDNTVAAEAPVDLAAGRNGRLIQDPSGRLTAAWTVDASRPDPGVKVTQSTAGAGGFNSPRVVSDATSAGELELSATGDGGGFAVFNANPSAPGPVVAVGFGDQAATGRPGLGNLPGGAGPVTNVSCQKVDFGRFAATTAQGCFLNGTGRYASVVVTSGEVNIAGVRLVPDPGTQIVIDPRRLTIDTIGPVRAIVSNGAAEVVLFRGQINRDLSRAVPGQNLFEFPVGAYKANVLGFNVEADIPVRLAPGGVRIPVDLQLPPAFGGFAGRAELLADPGRGLNLDSLDIRIGPVPLGALLIESIEIAWRSGNSWSGVGVVSVPAGGRIDADFQFEAGDFKGAGFNYTPTTPPAIGPFVYLLSFGGRLELRPVTILARALVGAGAAYRGEAPVKVNGQFTMRFPAGAPGEFDLRGSLQLFMFTVGGGYVQFLTNGYAEFGGTLEKIDLEVIELGPARVDGFVDARSGQFGATFQGQGAVCLVACVPAQARAAVSNDGFAACVTDVGVAFRWDELNPAALYNPVLLLQQIAEITAIPCDTGRFEAPRPGAGAARAAQAGGRSVRISRGLPTATLRVTGDGGAPQVTVTGPGGRKVVSGQRGGAGYDHPFPAIATTFVVLERPRAGTWTVAPNPGSAAITDVRVSGGFTPAAVAARVRGGRRASVAWRTRGLSAGQRIQFTESGRFGTRIIGSSSKARGVLRFRPAPGPGGRRTISALVQRRGITVARRALGRYLAPAPPRPGPVRGLRIRRARSSVTVTFRPPRGARHTIVKLRGARGSRMARTVSGRQRRVVFTGLRWETAISVEARSLSRELRAGPVRRAKSRKARR